MPRILADAPIDGQINAYSIMYGDSSPKKFTIKFPEMTVIEKTQIDNFDYKKYFNRENNNIKSLDYTYICSDGERPVTAPAIVGFQNTTNIFNIEHFDTASWGNTDNEIIITYMSNQYLITVNPLRIEKLNNSEKRKLTTYGKTVISDKNTVYKSPILNISIEKKQKDYQINTLINIKQKGQITSKKIAAQGNVYLYNQKLIYNCYPAIMIYDIEKNKDIVVTNGGWDTP